MPLPVVEATGVNLHLESGGTPLHILKDVDLTLVGGETEWRAAGGGLRAGELHCVRNEPCVGSRYLQSGAQEAHGPLCPPDPYSVGLADASLMESTDGGVQGGGGGLPGVTPAVGR